MQNIKISSRKARQMLLDEYMIEHDGKKLYEEIEEDLSIQTYQLKILKELLFRLYNEAPVETGYGRIASIKYRKESADRYSIIIGSETNAYGGQIADAPYMALQNEYYNPWIDRALWYVHSIRRAYDIIVTVSEPIEISHYITQSGNSPASGYIITVVFIGKRNKYNRKRKYSNNNRLSKE